MHKASNVMLNSMKGSNDIHVSLETKPLKTLQCVSIGKFDTVLAARVLITLIGLTLPTVCSTCTPVCPVIASKDLITVIEV